MALRLFLDYDYYKDRREDLRKLVEPEVLYNSMFFALAIKKHLFIYSSLTHSQMSVASNKQP
jgi:hypothetical protein